jgi:DNA-binding NtrC family response regulator
MDHLLRGTWPGNVRELENAVERAVILSVGEYVTERELPLSEVREESQPHSGEGVSSLAGMPLDDVEREVILATLRDVGGNKSEAPGSSHHPGHLAQETQEIRRRLAPFGRVREGRVPPGRRRRFPPVFFSPFLPARQAYLLADGEPA